MPAHYGNALGVEREGKQWRQAELRLGIVAQVDREGVAVGGPFDDPAVVGGSVPDETVGVHSQSHVLLVELDGTLNLERVVRAPVAEKESLEVELLIVDEGDVNHGEILQRSYA